MSDGSLRHWLLEHIQSILSKPTSPAPFILWSDPARAWKELLQKTCGDAIELWAGGSIDERLTIQVFNALSDQRKKRSY